MDYSSESEELFHIVEKEELQAMGLFKADRRVIENRDGVYVDVLREVEIPVALQDVIYQGAASNSWVVSGKHTKSGQPIIANDPHL